MQRQAVGNLVLRFAFIVQKKSEDNGADKSAKSTDKLNLSQKKIVEFILENGKVTNKDVQQLLGVKDSRALKILKELVEMDIVMKQGKLKGSYYILKVNAGKNI